MKREIIFKFEEDDNYDRVDFECNAKVKDLFAIRKLFNDEAFFNDLVHQAIKKMKFGEFYPLKDEEGEQYYDYK